MFYKREERMKAIEELKKCGEVKIFVIKNTKKRIYILAVQNNKDVSELIAKITKSSYKNFCKLKTLTLLEELNKYEIPFSVVFKSYNYRNGKGEKRNGRQENGKPEMP